MQPFYFYFWTQIGIIRSLRILRFFDNFELSHLARLQVIIDLKNLRYRHRICGIRAPSLLATFLAHGPYEAPALAVFKIVDLKGAH